jgi:serine/threonine protein kinase
MKVCPVCRSQYEDSFARCPRDGAILTVAPESTVSIGLNAATNPVGDPMIGRTVAGRYRILTKLGEGGMGAVYKAEQTKMNRLCALKIMSASFASDKDALARFNREAQMSSRLDHPNAITIYDFGEAEDGLVYLAMEFVEGEMLSTLLRRETVLGVDRALGIAQQMAAALDAAHKMNVIHRDLKPDNIMIARRDAGERVKILDFGIAKSALEDQRHDLTQTGMVIGTPLYMSPEQLSGEKVDARSDIYSFALIVYQTLTGALPFQGDNTQAIMIRRLTEAPLSTRMVNPNVHIPPEMERALLCGLARNREERFRTAGEFVAALIAGACGTGPVLQAASTGTHGATPPTSPFPNAESYQTAPGVAPANVPPPPPPRFDPSQPLAPAAAATPGGPPLMPAPVRPAARKSAAGGIVLAVAVFILVLVGGGGAAYLILFRTPSPAVGTSEKRDEVAKGDAPDAYQSGISLLRQKNYAEAEKKFRETLAVAPNNGKAYLNLAISLYHLNRLNESIDASSQAARLCDDAQSKHALHFHRGLARWEKKEYGPAAEEFQKSVSFKNDDFASLAFCGFMLHLSQGKAQADGVYAEVLSKATNPALLEAVKACKGGGTPPPTASDAGVGPGQ